MVTTNEMTNYAEFAVEKKVEGVYLLQRIAMWAAYFIVPILLMLLMLAMGLGAVALIVFIPIYFPFLLPKIIYPATYRYVDIEYEYIIAGGDMTVSCIFGRKSRKEWMPPVKVADMEVIAPYKGEYRAAADAPDITRRYEACATKNHPDNYYGIFTNDRGEKCVVIFQAINKALKVISFLNRNAVITQVSA